MSLLVAAWQPLHALAHRAASYAGMPRDPRVVFAVECGVVPSATFWLLVAFFGFLRVTGCADRYVTQGPQKRPSAALVFESAANAVLNHGLLQWAAAVWAIAPLLERCGVLANLTADAGASSYPLDSWWEHGWRLAACIAVEDTAFYWTHRLLHQKRLYAAIHKRHHSFVAMHPLAGEHAHIVETLLSNLMPYYLGPILFGLHGSTFALWTYMRIAEAVDGHSGYALPFAPLYSPLSALLSRPHHDFHHSHGGGPDGVGTTGVYGSLTPFWDWACGTDKPYYDHVAKLKAA